MENPIGLVSYRTPMAISRGTPSRGNFVAAPRGAAPNSPAASHAVSAMACGTSLRNWGTNVNGS